MTDVDPSNEAPNRPVPMNALRHGLRSEAFVLPGVESIDEWEQFRDDLLESLAPVGHFESEMANRVAHLSWRLRRALRAEREAVEHDSDPDNSPFLVMLKVLRSSRKEGPLDHVPAVPMRTPSLPNDGVLGKILRYEAQYTRQLFQTLHALQALQAKRNGQEVPLVRVQWH